MTLLSPPALPGSSAQDPPSSLLARLDPLAP